MLHRPVHNRSPRVCGSRPDVGFTIQRVFWPFRQSTSTTPSSIRIHPRMRLQALLAARTDQTQRIVVRRDHVRPLLVLFLFPLLATCLPDLSFTPHSDEASPLALGPFRADRFARTQY